MLSKKLTLIIFPSCEAKNLFNIINILNTIMFYVKISWSLKLHSPKRTGDAFILPERVPYQREASEKPQTKHTLAQHRLPQEKMK